MVCAIFFEGISREGEKASNALRETGIELIKVVDFGEDYGPPILQAEGKVMVGLAEIEEYCDSKRPTGDCDMK